MLTLTRPEWLWLLLVLPAFVLAAMAMRRAMEPVGWWGSLLLRCAAWVCLVVTLAEPQFVRSNKQISVIYVIDRSRSVPNDLQLAARQYVRRTAEKVRPGDRIGVVTFDGVARVELPTMPGRPDVVPFSPTDEPDQTDIAGALSLARAMFPPDTSRRLVLLTDGNETSGSLLDEIDAAIASGVAVDVVPLDYEAAREVWVDRLIAPSAVRPDSRVELRAVIRSRRPARAKVAWYHNGTAISTSNNTIELTGDGQADVLTMPLELREAGVHEFEVHVDPVDAAFDTFVENNRASAFAIVEGGERLLVLDPFGSSDSRPVAEAIRSEHLRVDHKTVADASIDLLDLQQYGAVVLGNISADQFNADQQEALASYVRDLGGGLILTGGDESFGAGGWVGTPIEEVSPVAFSLTPQQMPSPAAMVIVLDRSGSMASPVTPGPATQQQVANEAALLAVRSLLPIDLVGLVAFDSQPQWVVPLQPNRSPVRVAASIRSIQPGGGTDIYPALATAVEKLSAISGRSAARHIILLSDGQTAGGPFDQLVDKMVERGITLSVIGVGNAMNDPMLRRLATQGQGKYHPVQDPRQLPRVFFRETQMFRQRLVSEETFVPQVSAPSSPLLGGIEDSRIAPLGGYVRTRPKAEAIVALEFQRDDRREPVLAHWHYGMGSVVALTSGWWPRWGEQWTAWPEFGRFWKQAAEWVLKDASGDGFEVTTRIEGDRARVSVEALDKNLNYLNALDIRGVVITPGLEREPVRLKQTGAGQYEADFAIGAPGNYVISLGARGAALPGGGRSGGGAIRAGLNVSYSPEYRHFEARLPLLTAAAAKSGGTLRSLAAADTDDLFTRDLPPVTSRRPVWQWLLAWMVLPLFLLDVAVRRLQSKLAISVYVELAVLAFLVGLCHLTNAGAWAYVGSFVVAETVGWTMRRSMLRAALGYFAPATVQTAASRAQAMSRLRESQQRTQERLEEIEARSEVRTEARRAAAKESSTPPTVDAEEAEPPGTVEGFPGPTDSAGESTRDGAAKDSGARKDSGAPATDRLRAAKRRVRRRWE